MPALLIGAILLGSLHAMIPNHWMPVILLGRSEKWRTGTTLGITALAGFAHTSSTILIGLLIGFAGLNLSHSFEVYSRLVAPGILVLLGIFYIILDRIGRGGHSHEHHPHGHDDHHHDDHDHHDHHAAHSHSHQVNPPKAGKNKTLIVISLMAAMFFSPCLEIEAYYLQAATHGWQGILSVSLIYLILTVGGMLVLVSLGLKGVSRLNWHFLEHHEKLMTGLALVLIGVGAYYLKW